jgi:hypothetical protein
VIYLSIYSKLLLKRLVTEIDVDLLFDARFYCFCFNYDIEGFLNSLLKGDFGTDGDFYYYFSDIYDNGLLAAGFC